ncbi:hypothetical protein Bbelb_376410 [Branchiostoma belcheri]|nr:hypothetical protein Bbelb_376410 [Branchiostoma belcheri]
MFRKEVLLQYQDNIQTGTAGINLLGQTKGRTADNCSHNGDNSRQNVLLHPCHYPTKENSFPGRSRLIPVAIQKAAPRLIDDDADTGTCRSINTRLRLTDMGRGAPSLTCVCVCGGLPATCGGGRGRGAGYRRLIDDDADTGTCRSIPAQLRLTERLVCMWRKGISVGQFRVVPTVPDQLPCSDIDLMIDSIP